jgi:hypothetical protein
VRGMTSTRQMSMPRTSSTANRLVLPPTTPGRCPTCRSAALHPWRRAESLRSIRERCYGSGS